MPTYADLVARLGKLDGKLDVSVGEAPQETDLVVYNLFQVQSLKAWYQDSVDALATSDQRSLNLLVEQLAHSIRRLRCACDSEGLTKAFEEAPQDVQAKLTKLNNTMKARLRVFNDLATDLVASTHEVDADAKKHAQMIIETEHRLASEIGGLSSRIARVSFQNLTQECRAVEDLLQDNYAPHIYPRLDVMSGQTSLPANKTSGTPQPNTSTKQASTKQASTKQASTKQENTKQENTKQENTKKKQTNKMLATQRDANMLQTLHAKLLRVYAKLSSMRDDLAKAQVEGNLVLARRLEANIKQLKSNALAIGGACQLAAISNRKRVLVNMYTSSRGDYKRTKNVVSRLEKSIRHAKQPDMLAQWHYVQDRVHEQANGLRVFLTLEAKHEVDQVRRQAVKNMHRNAVLLFDLAEKALVPLDLSIAELSKDEFASSFHDSPDSTGLASNQTFKTCAQSLARKYSNDLARILHKLVALFPRNKSLEQQEQQEEQQEQQEEQQELQEQLALPTQVEVLVVTTQDNSKQQTQNKQEEEKDQEANKEEEKEKDKQEEEEKEKDKQEEEYKEEDNQEEDKEEEQEEEDEKDEYTNQDEANKKSKPQKDLPLDLDSLEGVSSDSDQEGYNSEDQSYDSEDQSYDSQASQSSGSYEPSPSKKRKLGSKQANKNVTKRAKPQRSPRSPRSPLK